MNKLKKLSIVCAALSVAALLVTCVGLLAMYAIHLPGTTMMPQSITFSLYMFPALAALSVLAKVFVDKRQSRQ